MSELLTYENIDAVLSGCEEEIRSMMKEDGLRPIDYRMLDTNATLLELGKYLRAQNSNLIRSNAELDNRTRGQIRVGG